MTAICKAIASTITYPFSLAKALPQVGPKPPVNLDTGREINVEVSSAAFARSKYFNRPKGEAKRARKGVGRTAARSTVFFTTLKINREDSLAALYEGVWG